MPLVHIHIVQPGSWTASVRLARIWLGGFPEDDRPVQCLSLRNLPAGTLPARALPFRNPSAGQKRSLAAGKMHLRIPQLDSPVGRMHLHSTLLLVPPSLVPSHVNASSLCVVLKGPPSAARFPLTTAVCIST